MAALAAAHYSYPHEFLEYPAWSGTSPGAAQSRGTSRAINRSKSCLAGSSKCLVGPSVLSESRAQIVTAQTVTMSKRSSRPRKSSGLRV
jgi:hypothetical protein